MAVNLRQTRAEADVPAVQVNLKVLVLVGSGSSLMSLRMVTSWGRGRCQEICSRGGRRAVAALASSIEPCGDLTNLRVDQMAGMGGEGVTSRSHTHFLSPSSLPGKCPR